MTDLVKLGEGSFAIVYLAKTPSGKEYALKISKTEIEKTLINKYALAEVAILELFKSSNKIINLIYYEINDEKNHIAIELLGKELYHLMKYYKYSNRRIPLTVIKHLSKQILEGLIELSDKDILHNDIKPENILFTKPISFLTQSKNTIVNKIFLAYRMLDEQNFIKLHVRNYSECMQEMILLKSSIKISDFGNAFSRKTALENPEEFSRAQPTRHYIAPEILISAPYWVESDMWSVGCIIYEMLTNQLMFDPTRENNMGVNSMNLAQIIQMLGPFSEANLAHGKKTNRYFINNIHKFNYLINKKETLYYNLHTIHKYNKKIAKHTNKFLLTLFCYDQKERATPINAIKSDWFL